MVSKLPPWIFWGAWALAFVAGIVNVVGLIGVGHQGITHLTGTTSLVGAAIAQLDAKSALHFGAVAGSFVAGCFISGFLIQDSALQMGRRYGVALILESLLLCLAVPLLQRNQMLGIYLASGACGLQNAMVSTYSGAVIRTTHLSGMFTDLGIFLGHTVRGIPVDPRRWRICILIITGFLCGGIAGAAGFKKINYSILFLPAFVIAGLALAYWILLGRRQKIASRAAS